MQTNNAASAKQLIKKLATDPKFRGDLAAASTRDEKHAVLTAAGFGQLTEDDVIHAAAPAAQEVRDSDLVATASAANAEGDTVTTVTTTTTVWAGAAAAVAAG